MYMLTEGYKKRMQELAGVKKSFINESLHPDSNMLGFYDMANGLTPVLLDLLKKNNVNFSYDSYRNFIDIETNNPKSLIPMFEAADMIDVKIPLKDAFEYYYPPNEPGDCVLVHLPKVDVPPGAMM